MHHSIINIDIDIIFFFQILNNLKLEVSKVTKLKSKILKNFYKMPEN